MFRAQQLAVTGFQIADADGTIDQSIRGSVLPALATLSRESTAGSENWNIYRPGDHANMMYWHLQGGLMGVPTRGAVAGSYSYALPASKDGGLFQPLAVPGVLDRDYEFLDIEEAGPDDYIIVATTKHGDRRKLAFRNATGRGIVIIADHRSAVVPDLSTIVHDGTGNTHDLVRKAGMHTVWEVREIGETWTPPPAGKTGILPTPIPTKQRFSIAWIANNPRNSVGGKCRIGFGDRDGYFAHSVSGPFVDSLESKHLLFQGGIDGPGISGALSTQAYWRGSGDPFSGPKEIEELPYPTVQEGKYAYWVRMKWDGAPKHWHVSNPKAKGEWRRYVRLPVGETPRCTPTKDYSRTDSNGNPARSYSEDSRLFIPKKQISSGIYFQPRVNLTQGRKPDRTLLGAKV